MTRASRQLADCYALQGSDDFRRSRLLMSWIWVVLAIAVVVLLLNVAVVFLLRAWNTDVGPNHESHNR
jgi:heme/copper-type cytochrome/quinol oxidase subunit 2